MIDVNDLSNEALTILYSMLKEIEYQIENKNVKILHCKIKSITYNELENRILNCTHHILSNSKCEIYDSVNNYNNEYINLSKATNNEILFLEMVAAEIEDYSCLGKGVRPYVDFFWNVFNNEIKKRNIKKDAFCMCELEF